MNDEERKRLDLLGELLKKDEPLPREDAQWLYSKIRVLMAPQRADEFLFPSYAALVSHHTIPCKAFPMRFFQRLNLMKEVSVDQGALGEGLAIPLTTIECEVCDAVMVVRPWVRVHPGVPEAVFSEFRKCALTLLCDGERLIRECPIDEFLLGPREETFRTGYASINPQTSQIAVYAAGRPGPENGESTIEPEYGCFVVNKTRISIELSILDHVAVEYSKGPREWSPRSFPPTPFKISAGLTAAKYTTKPG